MELPPFLQHPPRYVPLPHNPLPPSNLPEDRNFFPQHHHLPPPPSLPFPPPPPSYRPLPPPPSPPPYNPHLLKFPFLNHHRSIEDDLRRPNRLDFPHRSPPRVFDRSPIDEDLRHLSILKFDNPFSDSCPDSWADPPRVPPENRLPLSFDRETHHDHSPFSNRIHESSFRTSDNHRHDIEGSFRFRDDYAEGFRPNHNEELLRGRTDSRSSDLDDNYRHRHDWYGLNSSISSRSFEYRDSHVSNINPSRDIGSNSRNYQSFQGSVSNNDRNWNNRDENWRRNHARSSSGRLSDVPEESENNDYGNADGLPVSSRRVPSVYDSSGKFNYRGNRSNREFLHSPRKKIEKKSVLDRIQFHPSYKRNRNDGQRFSSARSDDSGPSNFRSRGSFVHPDDRMEEDREGSPVDLDVSFKSNALVAKAIVASSSHGVESNRNVSSSNWKNRKLTGADTDLVNSALTKLSDGPMEQKSSTYALECPTISHVDSKKLGEHVKDSGAGAVSVISSEPCPRGTDDLAGSNTPKECVSDTGGNTVGSDGTSSHRIRKKKKVISPISHVSNSQATKKDVDPVQADRSTNSPLTASQAGEDDMHLKEKAASASMIPAHNVDMQPSPNEVTAVFENNEANKSPWAVVEENGGIGIHSTHLSGLSSPLKTNVDEGMVVADRSVDLHTISNSDKGPSELQNGSTTGVCLVGGLSLHSCQNDPPVLLQNGLVNGFSEAMFSVGYTANTDLSSSEEIRIHGDLVNLYSRVHDMHNASSSDKGVIRGKLKTTVADIDAVGCSSDFNDATVLPESFEADGFPTDVVSVEGNAIVSFSSAEETDIHASVFDTYRCNHYTTSTSGPDSQFSEIGFLDENKMESFPDGATVLLGNIPVEGPPEARVPVGGNLHVNFGKDCSPNKRKDRDIHSDLVSPSSIGMPDNAISIVHPEATSLRCPVKDLSFVEEDVLGAGDFGAGSQPSRDKYSIVQGYSLTKGSFSDELSVKESVIDQNGLSPKYIKKRKVWAPVSRSPMLSETQEEFVTASISTFRVELASNTDEGLMQSEDRVAACNSGAVCSSSSPPCPESNPALGGSLDAGACEDIGLVNEGFSGNVSEEKGALVMTGMNTHIDIFCTERGSNVETVAAAKSAEEPGMLRRETVQQRNPLEIQSPDTDQWQPFTNMKCESDLLLKDGLPSVSNTLRLNEDDSDVSTTNLHNEMAEPDPDTVPIATGLEMFNSKMSLGQIFNEKGCEDVRKQDEKHMFEGLSSSYSSNASLKNTGIKKKPGYAVRSASSVKANAMPQDSRNTTCSVNTMSGVMNMKKNQPIPIVPRVFPGDLSMKKTAPSSHIATSRTWHRPGNAYASSHMGNNSYPNPATKIGKDQTTSYIRKGNSLVRKPCPVTAPPNVSNALSSSVYRLNSMGIEEMKKKTVVKSRFDLPSSLRTGLDATLERPKTPPLPCSTKLSNCSTFSSRNGASSPLADPPANGCSETESDPLQHNDMDVPKPSEDAPSSSGNHENQTGQINNCESQSVQEDTNPVSTKSRKMVYVKRKSNQLVAASSSSGLSRQHAEKTEAVTSDSYYKRRKNQIIRKLSEVTENIALRDDSLNSEGKRAPPVTTNSFSRRRSDKGVAKMYKPSKFSLVWTLRDAQALKKDNPLIHPVWPHLFPWKRTLHRRSLMHTSVSIFSNRSLSTISRKLLLSRKRETIYTRSTRGFSLRKSKVLSVGGSSLKWSKSIERNSKKANEEATLAVAAVEKKKREQNGVGAVTAGTKNRNRSSRERIFRIGSVRYRMDPTRRTLQRISDEELPNSVASQSGKDVRRTSVPKRLLIGNDEYVRIGNGNQLIRDPKKRTRLLASEKVRWSLHTARLRLAKKRKYCQFFTRFGKCNKDDGKCPYIHDPSKIAVCTKFLKGSCSDPNCKLTHKVIPERMQDCSYFLQGLCTNESCPYRHVNVNPNASVCEGFLRGYCADGNECRKKHSYVCPVFEETGICSRGSKCKLHHPKNRDKGKKKKPSIVQKNGRGRYFGSNISECKTAVSEKQSAKGDGDIFYQEGRFSDYIHLDVSDEESVEINDLASGQLISWNGDPTDVVLDDDELIKSINLMKRIRMKESPNPVESPK